MLSVLTILQFADRSEDQIWQICVSHKHDEFATSSQTNMQNAESRRCVLSPPYFYVHFICSPSALVFLSFGGSLKTGQIWTISPRVCPLILILFMALTAHPHRSMHSKFACTGFIQSEWTYSSIRGGARAPAWAGVVEKMDPHCRWEIDWIVPALNQLCFSRKVIVGGLLMGGCIRHLSQVSVLQ